MGDDTGIAWTDATWNPQVGCTVVSPGCTSCYAMREAARLAQWPASKVKYAGLVRETKGGPVWNGKVNYWEPALDQPLRWTKPRMIFVNSMSDLFYERTPFEWIDRVYARMAIAPWHIFQVLTKREERQREYLREDRRAKIYEEAEKVSEARRGYRSIGTGQWPLPNVWNGISAEDERRWDERVPVLLDTLTAMPWVSVEPQLELIDRDPTGLAWIVQGGESGKPRSKARPYDIAWSRVMRDRCAAAGVPFFEKQLGSVALSDGRPYPTKHYAGANPDEWPADIRVREYPATLQPQGKLL